MTINLTPRQIAWLERQVAEGAFSSIEEAAQFYLDQRMDCEELDLDNLDWAKPYVDEVLREIDSGIEGIPLEKFRIEIDEHMAKLRGK
jgi:Arc/MetJ-type ribon-helix-helix transcriptional regulator